MQLCIILHFWGTANNAYNDEPDFINNNINAFKVAGLQFIMMEAEVVYYLERAKEMLPAAMIITTLILPFLLRFHSHLIVHFVLGTFYTSGMLPPETKKCFDSLA